MVRSKVQTFAWTEPKVQYQVHGNPQRTGPNRTSATLFTGQQNHMVYVEGTTLRKTGQMEKGYAEIAWELSSAKILTAQLPFDHRLPQKGSTDSSGRPVSVVLSLWTYSKGVHFANAGEHNHVRPGHILHISKTEQLWFETLVNTNPKTGPLGLIVGVPGINRPGESVADISDVFLNAGCVGKERLKIKTKSHSGGDSLIAVFAKFSTEHPGFVIYSQLDSVTVISVQSSLMRSQLVKERLLEGPINGLVSDAAHGWWKEVQGTHLSSCCQFDILPRPSLLGSRSSLLHEWSIGWTL